MVFYFFFFFFKAEDGIRDRTVTGVQTCALPISAVQSHVFEWEGPDGSVVRTEYMPENGYSNAAHICDGDTIEAVVERLRPWFGDDPILGMVGTDHMPPVRDLVARLPEGARLVTLAEYFTDAFRSTGDTIRVRGELRSAA